MEMLQTVQSAVDHEIQVNIKPELPRPSLPKVLGLSESGAIVVTSAALGGALGILNWTVLLLSFPPARPGPELQTEGSGRSHYLLSVDLLIIS